jgi:hypothetical protein
MTAAEAAETVEAGAGVTAEPGVEAWIGVASAAGRRAVTATAPVLPVTAEAAASGVAEGGAAAGVAATQGEATAGQQAITPALQHLPPQVARWGALQVHKLVTAWFRTRTWPPFGRACGSLSLRALSPLLTVPPAMLMLTLYADVHMHYVCCATSASCSRKRTNCMKCGFAHARPAVCTGAVACNTASNIQYLLPCL